MNSLSHWGRRMPRSWAWAVWALAYDFLKRHGKHAVGVDSDPGKLEQARRAGRRVVYADAEDPGFWGKLDISHLEMILLAMPDLEAKRIAAAQIRRRGYDGLVSATVVYPEETTVIKGAGVDLAFNYYEEVGVGFAEHVIEAMQQP